MAMSIDWEYFFPDVCFDYSPIQQWQVKEWSKDDLNKIQDENGFWSPQKDFEFHLQKLKVDPKYFDEKNLALFPKGFSKPIYSILEFETARVDLLSRVKIINGEGIRGYEEMADGDETEIETFKIILDGIDKLVEVDKGTIGNSGNKHHIRCKRNVINCHRFNAIFILYDWLLSVSPKGGYQNNWQIFAYGISEYNDTFSYVDTFLVEDHHPYNFDDLDDLNNTKIITLNLDINSDKSYPTSSSADDIREYLKNWNPFIEDSPIEKEKKFQKKEIQQADIKEAASKTNDEAGDGISAL